MTTPDGWLIPILAKRSPDAIRILCDLVEAGLRHGRCSAVDIRVDTSALQEPNIVGAVFKILPRFGFTHTDQRLKSTAKKKHARRVDVWALTDQTKAQQFLDCQRRLLVKSGVEQQTLLKLQEEPWNPRRQTHRSAFSLSNPLAIAGSTPSASH